MNRLFSTGAMALAAAFAVPAAAQSTYTTSSSFSSAAGSTTTVNFEGCGNVAGQSLGTNGKLSSSGPCTGVPSGVTFSPSASGGDLYIAPPGQSANSSIALGLDNPTSGSIDIAFSTFENNFGVDLFQNFGGGTQSGSPASFTLALFNGTTLVNSYAVSVASATGSFFGITGSDPFNDLKISQAGGYAVIDNVQFGASAIATPTPEPATWAMMLVGFGLVGFGLRSAKRRSEVKFTARINGIASGAIA